MQKIILNLMLLIFFLQSCNSIKNVSKEKSIETKKMVVNIENKLIEYSWSALRKIT